MTPRSNRSNAVLDRRPPRPRRLARGLWYAGLRYQCPVCGGRFRRLMWNGNVDFANVCPYCESVDRERHLWLYLRRHTNLFSDRLRVLHLAPELCIEERLRRRSALEYVTADLDPEKAELTVDLTATGLPSESFDCILCVHVLEHIDDDRAAMKELHRLLRPGGWAIVNVPVQRDTTFEDESVTAPEERARVFGQADHVRIYGQDYVDRLRDAGFHVRVEIFRDELTLEDRERYALRFHWMRGKWDIDPDAIDDLYAIYLCTK